MSDTGAYDEPLEIEVLDGEVVMRSDRGPFAVSLTASAAARTAEDLAAAARVALGHQASQPSGERD